MMLMPKQKHWNMPGGGDVNKNMIWFFTIFIKTPSNLVDMAFAGFENEMKDCDVWEGFILMKKFIDTYVATNMATEDEIKKLEKIIDHESKIQDTDLNYDEFIIYLSRERINAQINKIISGKYHGGVDVPLWNILYSLRKIGKSMKFTGENIVDFMRGAVISNQCVYDELFWHISSDLSVSEKVTYTCLIAKRLIITPDGMAYMNIGNIVNWLTGLADFETIHPLMKCQLESISKKMFELYAESPLDSIKMAIRLLAKKCIRPAVEMTEKQQFELTYGAIMRDGYRIRMVAPSRNDCKVEFFTMDGLTVTKGRFESDTGCVILENGVVIPCF